MSSQMRLANFWGKKRANSSNVWDNFGFKCDDQGRILDRSMAVCRICLTEVRYSGGSTTNLTSHFNNHHKQERKESTQPGIRSAFCGSKKYAKSSSHYMMLQRRVAEYMISDMRPFNTVESQSFKNLCSALDSKFDLPSKTTFSQAVIPKMYQDTKAKIEEILKNCSSLAITADGWTSMATENYITLTGHFINTEWKMTNFALQTRHNPESHTAENLHTMFTAAFNEWKLTDKSLTGVVDNARNITKAWILLERPYINCFAHTMNLAVRKGLAAGSLKETLTRARKLVSHFHHSAQHSQALKEQQGTLNLPRHKLKMDVETRWNSTLDMIESVLESKEAITQVLIGDRQHRNLTLSPDEITVLEEVRDILKPWKQLTVRLSTEQNVTISMIAPIIHSLLNKGLQARALDTHMGAEVKAAMRTDLSKRYQDDAVKSLLHIASLLDPRFKSLVFLNDEEREDTYKNLEYKVMQTEDNRVKKQAIKLEKPTQSSAQPLPCMDSGNAMTEASELCVKSEQHALTESPPAKRIKSQDSTQDTFLDDFFGDIIITKVEKGPSVLDRFKQELRMYLSEDCLEAGANVLQWWREHSNKFPLIANVAKEMLGTPATSTPSERTFSKAGTLISAKRAMLKPAKVDQMLFLNKNYFQFKDD